MVRTAFLVVALLTLTACQPESDVPDSDSVPGNLVIKVYSTGETPVDDVQRHIQALFPSVNVRALPNGRIAVAAPAPQQPSVGELIKQLSKAEPEPARQVRVRQWLVEGTPADQVAIPDNLVTLENALLDTAELAGPMAFERLELIEFRVLDERQANAVGKIMDTSVWVQIQADRIQLMTETGTRPFGSRLETDISLASGERIVMGLVENPDRDSMLLFIVQAEIL